MNDENDPIMRAFEALVEQVPVLAVTKAAGKIDSVVFELDEDEVDQLDSADLSDLPDIIHDILSSHASDIEPLCHHFIDPKTRYTLDEESLSIEGCEMDDEGVGRASCVFTASATWGCRDIDDLADERDCFVDLSLDRKNWAICVSTIVHDYEPETEEF